jgi:hypothetical protein
MYCQMNVILQNILQKRQVLDGKYYNHKNIYDITQCTRIGSQFLWLTIQELEVVLPFLPYMDDGIFMF